jgi:hypothetical protein
MIFQIWKQNKNDQTKSSSNFSKKKNWNISKKKKTEIGKGEKHRFLKISFSFLSFLT